MEGADPMRIPKQFQLLNRWYSVETFVPGCDPDDPEGKNDPPKGLTTIDRRKIYLNPAANADREDLEHTFLHELVHAILNGMGETRLSDSEKFVDVFAAMLHQALISYVGEYDDQYHKS